MHEGVRRSFHLEEGLVPRVLGVAHEIPARVERETRRFEVAADHRLVDPVYVPGESPEFDETILAGIDPLPTSPGGGGFVADFLDTARGPYEDPFNPSHAWLTSPYLRDSRMCGTCHDVSNPAVGDLAHNHGSMIPLPGTSSGVVNGPVADKAASGDGPGVTLSKKGV